MKETINTLTEDQLTIMCEEDSLAPVAAQITESSTITLSNSRGSLHVEFVEGEGIVRVASPAEHYVLLDITQAPSRLAITTDEMRNVTVGLVCSIEDATSASIVTIDDSYAYVPVGVAVIYEREAFWADPDESLLVQLNSRCFRVTDCSSPECFADLLWGIQGNDDEMINQWAEEMDSDEFHEIVQKGALTPSAVIDGRDGGITLPKPIDEIQLFTRYALGICPWDYPIFMDRHDISWQFAELVGPARKTEDGQSPAQDFISACTTDLGVLRTQISGLESAWASHPQALRDLDPLRERLFQVEDKFEDVLLGEVITPCTQDMIAALQGLRKLRGKESDHQEWYAAFHRDNPDLLLMPLTALKSEVTELEKLLQS